MSKPGWERIEEFHKAHAKQERCYADSSARVKRWRDRQGKATLTYLAPSMIEALKAEARRKNKAVWKLLRSCVSYGLPQAQRRGW